jgi:hypothetical protein
MLLAAAVQEIKGSLVIWAVLVVVTVHNPHHREELEHQIKVMLVAADNQ